MSNLILASFLFFSTLFVLVPFSYAADCSTFKDCLNCTNSGCGWCNSTKSCEATTTPKTCPDTLLLNCNCSIHTTCSQCALAPQCGWCPSMKECLTSNSTVCNVVNVCECTTNRNCFDCLLEAGCGWCKTTSTCHLPDDAGSCALSSNCSCSDIRSCEACSYYPNCKWCEESETSAEFCYSSGGSICQTPSQSCAGITTTSGGDDGDGGDGLDVASFVGGIFLGIGIICILFGGLYLWRRHQEKQAQKYSNVM